LKIVRKNYENLKNDNFISETGNSTIFNDLKKKVIGKRKEDFLYKGTRDI